MGEGWASGADSTPPPPSASIHSGVGERLDREDPTLCLELLLENSSFSPKKEFEDKRL